jgi:SAM-dependent methyltransferase
MKELCGVIAHEKSLAPLGEIGCGDGKFSSLLFPRIDIGIDININAINKCRNYNTAYAHVAVMDARKLGLKGNEYQIVFSNCALEHIADVDKVIMEAYRILKPGGKLIISVPLEDMNDHLTLRSNWYVRIRKKQLSHVNLWKASQWRERFEICGFNDISMYPYLPARLCRLWDNLDLPFCIGHGKYSAYGLFLVLWRILPQRIRAFYISLMVNLLSRYESDVGPPRCAAVLVAVKGAD